MLRRYLHIVAALTVISASFSAQAQQKHFIPLNKNNGTKQYASLQQARKTSGIISNKTLRSDKRALKQGSLRFDRAKLTINTRAARNVVKVSRPETNAALKAANESAAVSNVTRVSGVEHAWPVALGAKQRISSKYGTRKDPFTGKPAFHGGLDIAANSGTDVLASAAGVVSNVGPKGKFGNHVSIKHADGTVSMYGHLLNQTVKVGTRVRQGQKIGEVGSTGRSTGAHLDFRLKKDGKTIDPARIISRRTAPGHLQAQLSNNKGKAFKAPAKANRSFRIIKVQ